MNWPGVTLWEPTVTPRTLEGSRTQRERAELTLSQTRMVALMVGCCGERWRGEGGKVVISRG